MDNKYDNLIVSNLNAFALKFVIRFIAKFIVITAIMKPMESMSINSYNNSIVAKVGGIFNGLDAQSCAYRISHSEDDLVVRVEFESVYG